MASVQIEQCILCKVDVSKGTNKVKRKKFYSAKTDSFRKILNDISMESFAVPICDQVGKESYICLSLRVIPSLAATDITILSISKSKIKN